MAQELDPAFKPKLDPAFKPAQPVQTAELDSAFKPVSTEPEPEESGLIDNIIQWGTTPLIGGDNPLVQQAMESPELPGPELKHRLASEVSSPFALIGELLGGAGVLYGGLKAFRHFNRARRVGDAVAGAVDDVPTPITRAEPEDSFLEVSDDVLEAPTTGTFTAGRSEGPLPQAYRDRSGEAAMEGLVPDRYKIKINETPVETPTPEVANAIKRQPETQAMFDATNARFLDVLKEGKPLMHAVEPQDLVNIADQIKLNPNLLPEEMKSARHGITQLMKGEIPSPTEIHYLADTFGDEFADALIHQVVKDRTKVGKTQDFMRAIMTSFDLSAPGRQGKKFWYTKEFRQSFPAMFRAWGDEKAYKAVIDSILEHPNFVRPRDESGRVIGRSLAERAGIDITDFLTRREEIFGSRLAEKFPGVKASQRAYVAFLNKLRADRFNTLLTRAEKAGHEIDDKFLKGLGDFINNATGRGSLDLKIGGRQVLSDQKDQGWLNQIFFAPKLHAGKLRLWGQGVRGVLDPIAKRVLSPEHYTAMDPMIRKEVLKTLANDAALSAAVMGLVSEMGAEVETDPASSDFMKAKIGNTRIDPHAGDQQYLVAFTRLFSNRYVSPTSGREHEPWSFEYGQANPGKILADFTANKLAPLPSALVNIMFGRNIEAEGLTDSVTSEMVDKIIPIMMQDMKEIYEEDPDLLPLLIPSMFGVGVQNYGR